MIKVKMTYFIPSQKTNNDVQVIELYFKEVVYLHGISKNITSDQDIQFLSHFGGPWGKNEY